MASTQVATRNGNGGASDAPRRTLKDALEARAGEFERALAGRIDVGAFIRVALTMVNKSPQLAECTVPSIMFALLECANLGLNPNGVMGEAYLVPFNNKVKDAGGQERWEKQAQFIPGYRGLVKLARQSGVVKTVKTNMVREGDQFEVHFGIDDHLRHIPDFDNSDRDDAPLRYVYAIAYFTDGAAQFEVMSKGAVDKIRRRSKAADRGPWVTDYEEMALKTVVRRLCKRLPLSDFDLARAIEADNEGERLMEGSVAGAASMPALPETRTDRLVQRFSAGAPAAGDDGVPAAPVDAEWGAAMNAPAAAEVSVTPDAAPALSEAERAFLALVMDTPKGNGLTPRAEDVDRAKMRDVAETLAAAGFTAEGKRLAALAVDTKLSAAQARMILLRAVDANLITAEPQADAAEPGALEL